MNFLHGPCHNALPHSTPWQMGHLAHNSSFFSTHLSYSDFALPTREFGGTATALIRDSIRLDGDPMLLLKAAGSKARFCLTTPVIWTPSAGNRDPAALVSHTPRLPFAISAAVGYQSGESLFYQTAFAHTLYFGRRLSYERFVWQPSMMWQLAVHTTCRRDVLSIPEPLCGKTARGKPRTPVTRGRAVARDGSGLNASRLLFPRREREREIDR